MNGFFASSCKVHVDYDAVRKAMEEIKETFDADNYKIRLPRIGSGLGGGDWEIISKIIDEVFDDRDILVVDL